MPRTVWRRRRPRLDRGPCRAMATKILAAACRAARRSAGSVATAMSDRRASASSMSSAIRADSASSSSLPTSGETCSSCGWAALSEERLWVRRPASLTASRASEPSNGLGR
jgi:hypothetical protein